MTKANNLFDELPRSPRKVLMHVIDAGNGWGFQPGGQT